MILWATLLLAGCHGHVAKTYDPEIERVVNELMSQPHPLGRVKTDAFGPGVSMDATGRAVTLQPAIPTLGGYYGDSRIQQPNAFGPGIHMDQYGRAVQFR